MLERTILQGTVFINKIRMLQRTQILQRTVFYAFIMENSIIVFTRKRLFIFFMFVRLFMFLLGKVCSEFSIRKFVYAFQIYMYGV